MINKNILVIGAGVIGLTTALCLRKSKFNVTIVAEKFAPDVTSVVAGALWEWPPAVCGYHHDQTSLERSKQWCMISYDIFHKLALDKLSGVFIRPVTFYFKYLIKENPMALHKMNEMKNKVKNFRHNVALVKEKDINQKINLKDAYCHDAPMIDTDTYMGWLMREAKNIGIKIIQEKIIGNLANNINDIKKNFDVDLIINCAGLGASELSNEYMYPLRGALIRVHNDGKKMPKINEAFCVSHDESTTEQDIIFIVPRGDNMLVLGGLAEKDEWYKNINLENYKPIRDMYERCIEFLPMLKGAQIDGYEPIRVGLRPFRSANVRLELDNDLDVIHSYGHGGAGVSFSWGCALETVKLANKLFNTTTADFSSLNIEGSNYYLSAINGIYSL